MWKTNQGAVWAATQHIARFTGSIWFVDGVGGVDTNSGTRPEDAFLTIGAAISACAAGDAIAIKAATYTETGLDVNKNSVELWPEIGTIIDPASGTALTLSGNFCKIWSPGGILQITPAANQTGLLISGSYCYISDVCVEAGSSADLGFDITGNDNTLRDCCCTAPLVAAYKIQGDHNRVIDSQTGGEVADTSIGYWMTNSSDKVRLLRCVSQGHATSGFQIDTGCTGGIVAHCASGNGDGRWSDVDHSATWPHFSYNDEVRKTATLSVGQTINLWQVTGTVKITEIYGIVEEIVVSAGAPTLHLSAFSANGEVDITADPGPNIDDDVVGTVYVKQSDSTGALAKGENDNTPFIVENGDYKEPDVGIIVGADDAADTFIRSNVNAACTAGIIHWHCKWKPISDLGFLKAV